MEMAKKRNFQLGNCPSRKKDESHPHGYFIPEERAVVEIAFLAIRRRKGRKK